MAKIKCLECPHEIFYSAKGGVIRYVKCKSTYEWDGDNISLLSSIVVEQAEEARKRIEYFKLTGDDSKLV